MAVDISAQLRAIANDEYGETVLNNIGSAAEVLNESATIYNGIYGRDIRRSIHDALYKLSISAPSGGGYTAMIGTPVLIINRGFFGNVPLHGTPVIEEG